MNAFVAKYRHLENSNTEILLLKDVLEFDLCLPSAWVLLGTYGPNMDLTGFLWSKYECFLISCCKDIDI